MWNRFCAHKHFVRLSSIIFHNIFFIHFQFNMVIAISKFYFVIKWFLELSIQFGKNYKIKRNIYLFNKAFSSSCKRFTSYWCCYWWCWHFQNHLIPKRENKLFHTQIRLFDTFLQNQLMAVQRDFLLCLVFSPFGLNVCKIFQKTKKNSK